MPYRIAQPIGDRPRLRPKRPTQFDRLTNMPFRYAFAGAISGYQRFLSPYKGYRCAHRALHGGWSCSEFGRRAVLRFGILRFLLLLRRRFARCTQAHVALKNQATKGDNTRERPFYKTVKSDNMGQTTII